MQTINIIIGLPGSGKTTYIRNAFEGFDDLVICDDYHKSSYNHSHEFVDSIYYQDLERALQNGKNVVISDIARCRPERKILLEENIQKILKKIGIHAQTKFFFFENNPEACKKNILQRNRGGRVERELEFVDEVSCHYVIPEGANVIPITTIP